MQLLIIELAFSYPKVRLYKELIKIVNNGAGLNFEFL